MLQLQKEISVPYNEEKGEYETCKVYDVDWWDYSEEELLNNSKYTYTIHKIGQKITVEPG